jgi:hypothetical protein
MSTGDGGLLYQRLRNSGMRRREAEQRTWLEAFNEGIRRGREEASVDLGPVAPMSTADEPVYGMRRDAFRIPDYGASFASTGMGFDLGVAPDTTVVSGLGFQPRVVHISWNPTGAVWTSEDEPMRVGHDGFTTIVEDELARNTQAEIEGEIRRLLMERADLIVRDQVEQRLAPPVALQGRGPRRIRVRDE